MSILPIDMSGAKALAATQCRLEGRSAHGASQVSGTSAWSKSRRDRDQVNRLHTTSVDYFFDLQPTTFSVEEMPTIQNTSISTYLFFKSTKLCARHVVGDRPDETV